MRKSITIEVATLNEQCCNQENILKGSKKSRGLLSIIFLCVSFFIEKKRGIEMKIISQTM